MRRRIAAANWKMNLTLEEAKTLVQRIKDLKPVLSEEKEIILCIPLPYLNEIKNDLLNSDHYYVGSQNIANHASGAYTGETSATMLKSINTDYVIIGHSERRGYYAETNAILKEKVDLALSEDLKVIFCCGESLEIREANTQNEFVKKQLEESLLHLDASALKNVIIAYEPIWAIGTGKTATPQQAQEMHAFIRSILAEKYNEEVADQCTLLYGGSCKPTNAAELFACEDVDGSLIGGASLKADSFVAIVNEL